MGTKTAVVAAAVEVKSRIWVRERRRWRGSMRFSFVVVRRKVCCRRKRVRRAPKTMNTAMVRPSFQGQVAPAKVRTRVKETQTPAERRKPSQSMWATFSGVLCWGSRLMEGRKKK